MGNFRCCGLALLALIGCTDPVQRVPSRVDVSVDADQIVRINTVRVEVEIEIQPTSGAGWENEERRTFRPDPTQIIWPIAFQTKATTDQAIPSFNLVAFAFDKQDAVVARAQAIRDSKRVGETGLRVHFEAGCYRQPQLCNDGETCSNGACVNAREESPLTAAQAGDEGAGPTKTGQLASADQRAPDAGLAKAGEACSGDARACSEHGSRNPLHCEGGTWIASPECSADQRCDSATGGTLGTCQPIAHECQGQQPNVAFCDADIMLVCMDLVSAETRPCLENQHCVPGASEARCECRVGFVADGTSCRAATTCDENRGGCDPQTTCSLVAGKPTCSPCPSGYAGTGELGCEPLLQSLDTGGLSFTPVVSDAASAYHVSVPLLAPVLTLSAAAPAGTHLTFDSLDVPAGEAWHSPLLPLGETKVELVLTSGVGAKSTYEITLSRSGAETSYIKPSNTGDADQFGTSVAISGDTVAVGAPMEDSNATTIDGDQSNDASTNSGAAYVFRRTGSSWVQEAYIKASDGQASDSFGINLGLDGDTLIVGAIRAEYSETYIVGQRPGIAYVFTRTGGKWSETQKLLPSDTEPGNVFGAGIALDGDTLAIGALNAAGPTGERPGAVYVFERTGDRWEERQKLTPTEPAGVGGFGASVALSGDRLAVGAPFDALGRRGTAFVFERRNGVWSEQQRLPPEPLEAGATYGFKVAIEGDRLAVGAPRESYEMTRTGTAAGEAYVYEFSDGSWRKGEVLRAPNSAASDYFGGTVSFVKGVLLVGGYQEDGSSRGLDGDPMATGESQSGAVFMYAKNGELWELANYLKASNASAGNWFGWTLATTDNTLVVAAPYEGTNATGIDQPSSGATPNSGAVYVFE